MITHFAELELHMLSLSVVRLVYHERLRFPILAETDNFLAFAITTHTVLKFTLRQEPVTHAHFAFQVSHAGFAEVADKIKGAGLLVTHEHVDWGDGQSLYFRDGEGHGLEIIAHARIADDVLPQCYHLGILYLREVAFHVESVPHFRRWLREILEMKSQSDNEADDFDFVIGGTAHAVVSALSRCGYPGGSCSVPTNQRVTLGTPDREFMRRVRERLAATGELVAEQPEEIEFQHAGYRFTLRHTPQFSAEWLARLHL
jgi:hypothetical protein